MSQDNKRELEAAEERLREKTAEASTYLQDNEHLRVLFVTYCCIIKPPLAP